MWREDPLIQVSRPVANFLRQHFRLLLPVVFLRHSRLLVAEVVAEHRVEVVAGEEAVVEEAVARRRDALYFRQKRSGKWLARRLLMNCIALSQPA